MYINLTKILRIPGVILGLVPLGFGIYKFITAININMQIAATLVALFGLQFIWFVFWITKNNK